MLPRPSRSGMPMRSGFGIPYRDLGQHRPPYRPGFGDHHRGRDRDHDHDRGRHGRFAGAYGYGYPGWSYASPYPYVIDPGFYDWGDTGDYGDDQADATSNYAPYSNGGEPYPQDQQQAYDAQRPYPQAPPSQQYQPESAPGAARPPYSAMSAPSAPLPEERLTLIFKDGRAPQTMRNYMMNAKELTDLDPQHFARIPLDEIDIAATVQTNRAHGVDFQVPGTLRD